MGSGHKALYLAIFEGVESENNAKTSLKQVYFVNFPILYKLSLPFNFRQPQRNGKYLKMKIFPEVVYIINFRCFAV